MCCTCTTISITLVFGSTLVDDHAVDLKSVCLKPLYSDMAERMRKVRLTVVLIRRLFPSSCLSHLQSESKCEVFCDDN